MKARFLGSAAIVCAILTLELHAGGQQAPTPVKPIDFTFAPIGTGLPVAVQDRLDEAQLLVGDNPNLKGILTLCIDLKSEWGAFRKDNSAKMEIIPPFKAFDNVWGIGDSTLMTWAIVTSEGIIQIDAMHNADEAEKIIVAGYKKAGLDPNQIKYVILTHSHAEHYGGGKYLQDTFHPHVVMGAADWDVIEKAPNPPPAKRDIAVTGQQKLTLGDTTIMMYESPGHTPGTLNLMIPVTDRGQKHLASMVGGTGVPHGIENLQAYQKSFSNFFKTGETQKVDVMLSNHPWFDNTFSDGKTDKYTRALTRGPNDPNPWVVGQSEYVAAMGADLACLESSKARLKETGGQ